jgi:hypothetical protein
MVAELLKTGKHTITALTRVDSTSKVPEGVQIAKIDYAQPESLVKALRGQDALIITMSTAASQDQQMALIKAAGEAGVQFVMPNEWGPDTANDGLVKDVWLFQAVAEVRKAIEELGTVSYISLVCGYWYEWSLGIESAYGVDLVNKKVTFFDDGEVKISTTTWPQLGRAVAALLSLPIKPEAGSAEACLEKFRNTMVYVKSFTVSQKDMFESALRVTGTKSEEWEIVTQSSKERYDAGAEVFKTGDRNGFIHMM